MRMGRNAGDADRVRCVNPEDLNIRAANFGISLAAANGARLRSSRIGRIDWLRMDTLG